MNREDLERLMQGIDLGNLVLCEPVAMPRSDEPPTEVCLALAGVYEGHPSGAVTIDQALAETVERNRVELGFDPPIDERHTSSMPYIPAPRFGVVGRYEWRDDELWATDLRWNERGRQSWTDDEYGYVSLGMLRNPKHPLTNKPMGPVMHHLALTNTPFFGGAAALAEGGQEDTNMKLEEITSALEQDADLKTKLLVELKVAPVTNVEASLEPIAIDPRIVERLGLADDADADAVVAELDKRQQSRAQAIVASAVAAGKVPKDPESKMHKSLLVMAEQNPEAAEEFVASMSSQAPTGTAPKPPAERDDDDELEIDDDQAQINAQLGLSDEDWEKYAPKDD